jgi:hypothetical protein
MARVLIFFVCNGRRRRMAGKKRVRDLGAEAAAVARPRKAAFGAEAMGVVVAALRRGATVKAAAREAGFSEATVHAWRRKAPHFGAACRDALDTREALVVPGNGGREWQLRKPRRNDFSRRRKRIYLEHFAATGDTRASAAAAGISKSTVSNHKLSDPAFREACAQALLEAYANLEAEAVRQRLAAMEKIDFDPGKEAPPSGLDPEAEFARTMELLREHKRSRAGMKAGGRPPERWSFAESMAALEKRLKILGIRVREDGERAPDDDDE